MINFWHIVAQGFGIYDQNLLNGSIDKQLVLGSIIHHALSSPLSVISSNCDQRKKGKAIAHIERLLDEFRHTDLVEEFSLGHTIALISQQLESIPGSDRLYFAHHKSQDVKLRGKQGLLVEAVICLVKNALQSSQETLVGLHLVANHSEVKISVADFGSGMSGWQQIRASKLFTTSKHNGTGVGLPFSRWVIERVFNGKMHILSKLNLGTMVVIILPCAKS